MFFIINLMLVVIAGMLVLVIAATASLPGHEPSDPVAPEGDWVGRASLPRIRPVKVRAPIRVVRAARIGAVESH